MALLGATSWLLHTQMEIAVYVSMLQLQMHAPKAVDRRRLNRVIRWVQRNPRGPTYRQRLEPRVLLAVGDSAFQAPTDEEITEKDPLVMRGYTLVWAHRVNDDNSRPAASGVGGGGSSADTALTSVSSASTLTATTRKVLAGVAIGRIRYLLQLLDYTAG